MGINDRHYMKGPSTVGGRFNRLPKTVTARYVALCAIAYLLSLLLFPSHIDNPLLFSQQAIFQNFEFWRLFTPAFFAEPNTIVGVAIGLFIFYLIATYIEEMMGSRRFLNLLVCCTLTSALFGLFVPFPLYYGYFGGFVSAMFVSWGLLLGREKITLMLMFLIPLTLSGHMIIALSVGIIVIQCLLREEYWLQGISMLGSCAGAYIFTTQYQLGKNIDLVKYFERKKKPVKKKAPKKNTNQQQFRVVDDEEDIEDVDAYIKANVDPILEKIAQSGMGSLSAQEKKILQQAKNKINKH